MGYYAGIGPGLRGLGVEPREPNIACDGCGQTVFIPGIPPKWFLDGKAPRGWLTKRLPDGTRTDYCGKCMADAAPPGDHPPCWDDCGSADGRDATPASIGCGDCNMKEETDE